MQWIIDIAKEAMEQYLIDNPRFVDRGDPASVDYAIGDFTKDGQWHDLDLSALIPADAAGVLIRCAITSQSALYTLELQTKGNVNTNNVGTIATQSAWTPIAGDLTVSPDSNREIQYRASNDFGQWTGINVVIAGWWL